MRSSLGSLPKNSIQEELVSAAQGLACEAAGRRGRWESEGVLGGGVARRWGCLSLERDLQAAFMRRSRSLGMPPPHQPWERFSAKKHAGFASLACSHTPVPPAAPTLLGSPGSCSLPRRPLQPSSHLHPHHPHSLSSQPEIVYCPLLYCLLAPQEREGVEHRRQRAHPVTLNAGGSRMKERLNVRRARDPE